MEFGGVNGGDMEVSILSLFILKLVFVVIVAVVILLYSRPTKLRW